MSDRRMNKQTACISKRSAASAVAAGATPKFSRAIWQRWGIASALLALTLWAFWPVAYRLFRDWQGDPNYSVGQLVPLAAFYVLWDRRNSWRKCTLRPCWWGLALCLAAVAVWYAGLLFLYESAERFALVLMILGLVMWIGGWQLFFKIRWILLMLFLMTVFLLEAGGIEVAREGNTLLLGRDTRVGIAEACSGLRMLTAFVIVAATFALLVDRPRWQKIVLLISSIPIAILCNMLRLIVTVIIYKLVFAELWLLRKLVVEDPVRSA